MEIYWGFGFSWLVMVDGSLGLLVSCRPTLITFILPLPVIMNKGSDSVHMPVTCVEDWREVGLQFQTLCVVR